MASCIINNSLKEFQNNSAEKINDAAGKRDVEAMNNALQEVNQSRLTSGSFCNNAKTLDAKLSSAGKEATDLLEIPNIFDNGPSTFGLEINKDWANKASGK